MRYAHSSSDSFLYKTDFHLSYTIFKLSFFTTVYSIATIIANATTHTIAIPCIGINSTNNAEKLIAMCNKIKAPIDFSCSSTTANSIPISTACITHKNCKCTNPNKTELNTTTKEVGIAFLNLDKIIPRNTISSGIGNNSIA